MNEEKNMQWQRAAHGSDWNYELRLRGETRVRLTMARGTVDVEGTLGSWRLEGDVTRSLAIVDAAKGAAVGRVERSNWTGQRTGRLFKHRLTWRRVSLLHMSWAIELDGTPLVVLRRTGLLRANYFAQLTTEADVTPAAERELLCALAFVLLLNSERDDAIAAGVSVIG